jgi:hypothetical protein
MVAERLNCVQNQMTIRDHVLIRNKVAALIITGGQVNIQAVAGQMLTFFSELGLSFPQFPFIAHSRGWSAEDMERNVDYVRNSRELHQGAVELVGRCMELANLLMARAGKPEKMTCGGRKAHRLDVMFSDLPRRGVMLQRSTNQSLNCGPSGSRGQDRRDGPARGPLCTPIGSRGLDR